MPDSPHPIANPADKEPPEIALFLAVALAVLCAFLRTTVEPPLHFDTLRDLLMASDCASGARCPSEGAPTSFGGLFQGGLWIQFLALCHRAGLGPTGSGRAVLALHALGAAVVYRTARRFSLPASAPLAATLFFLGSAVAVGWPILWNPSIAPLPLALAIHCLLYVASGGGIIAAIGCGLALGLVVGSHVIGLLLVPLVLATLVALAARPLLYFSAAALAFVAVVYLTAGDAVRHSSQVMSPRLRALVIGALLISPFAGALARRLIHHISSFQTVGVRTWAALLATSFAYLPITLVAMRVLHSRSSLHYLLPALPALSLMIAWLVIAPLHRIAQRLLPSPRIPGWLSPFALVALFLIPAALLLPHLASGPPRATGITPACPQWTLGETDRIAHYLYARGLTYDALLRHIEGPSLYPLISGIALVDPPKAPVPKVDALNRKDIVVVKLARESLPSPLPPDWQIVELDARAVAVLRPIIPYLDRGQMTVAIDPHDGGAPDVSHIPFNVHVPHAVGAMGRAYPEWIGLRDRLQSPALAHLRSYGLRYDLSVRVPEGGAPHTVLMFDEALSFVITSLEGPWPARLPDVAVTLSAPGQGTLGLATEVEDPSRDRHFPPSMVELPSDDPLLPLLDDPTVRCTE